MFSGSSSQIWVCIRKTCRICWSTYFWAQTLELWIYLIWGRVWWWRRWWHPTPVLLPGKSWTEELGRLQSMGSCRVGHNWATSLSLFTSCIGEGNGNPLQCSCLENPRDGEAWWAAVYGVSQSRTRQKRLSSCRSIRVWWFVFLTASQAMLVLLVLGSHFETNCTLSSSGCQEIFGLFTIYSCHKQCHNLLKSKCHDLLVPSVPEK